MVRLQCQRCYRVYPESFIWIDNLYGHDLCDDCYHGKPIKDRSKLPSVEKIVVVKRWLQGQDRRRIKVVFSHSGECFYGKEYNADELLPSEYLDKEVIKGWYDDDPYRIPFANDHIWDWKEIAATEVVWTFDGDKSYLAKCGNLTFCIVPVTGVKGGWKLSFGIEGKVGFDCVWPQAIFQEIEDARKVCNDIMAAFNKKG